MHVPNLARSSSPTTSKSRTSFRTAVVPSHRPQAKQRTTKLQIVVGVIRQLQDNMSPHLAPAQEAYAEHKGQPCGTCLNEEAGDCHNDAGKLIREVTSWVGGNTRRAEQRNSSPSRCCTMRSPDSSNQLRPATIPRGG